jgi:hypothetical protein
VPPDGRKTPGQPRPAHAPEGDPVYFEITPSGKFLRVTAICGRTGVEASILGPPGGSRAALEQAALNKLRYVQGKQKS